MRPGFVLYYIPSSHVSSAASIYQDFLARALCCAAGSLAIESFFPLRGAAMKQVRRFLVLIQLLAIVAIGCSRNPRARSEKFIKSGDGYFEQGKYAEAAIEYMNAVRADRTSAAAHQHLATAERNLGDWGTAKRELELTVELQPNNT